MTINDSKDVVAILPYVDGKVLLQLRDQKPDIVFPGHWGFFSGSIEGDETPEQAAWRELWEELEYKPKQIFKLASRKIPELNKISHIFYFPLTVPVNCLVLHEGMDLGLFSWEEIVGKQLYSQLKKDIFPLINTPFVLTAISDVLQKANSNKDRSLLS